MRKISACHYMRCCHGNGFNPDIDNQNVSLILTVPILVNHHGKNLKRNSLRFLVEVALYREGVSQ